MGSNLVIVALPADDDVVWKVSSEEKPHMTLLFLGDAASNPKTNDIIGFVEHAVTIAEHGEFYMEVDHRGELGPDKADVLFFRNKGWSGRWIAGFRSQLLQEPNIKTAYDSTTQYDAWTPHLTLGYPTAPANEDKIPDYGFGSVRFDRIAVWTQDFDGPEFRLEWPEYQDSDLAVAYSDTVSVGQGLVSDVLAHASIMDNKGVRDKIKAKVKSILDDVTGDADGDLGPDPDPQILTKLKSLVDDFSGDADKDLIQSAMTEAFIEHYGVKGMKWGVRKAPSVVARPKNALTTKQKVAVGAGGVAGTLVLPGLGTLAGLHATRINPDINRAINENAKNYKAFQKDKKWEKDFQRAKGFKFDDSAFTANYNKKWEKEDFSKEDPAKPSKKYQQYIDGYMKSMSTEYAKQFANHYGDSPSKKYEAFHVPGTEMVKLRVKGSAQHSLEDGVLVTFRITFDDNGLISGIEPVDDSMAQSNLTAADFIDGLLHYGVKGMKWGVHKDRSTPEPRMATATSRVPAGAKRKTKLQVSGGENHPAHPDAVYVAEAKAKLQKSGVHALSNKELMDVARRIQLEEQVKSLMTSKGRKFVRNQLQTEGQNLARGAARTGVRKVGGHAVRRATKIGAVAALA